MKNSEINIRDPFVLTYGSKYYMYGTRASNFGCKTKGFDVYLSDDLVNWSMPCEAFNSTAFGLDRNVNWAPEVHFYNGKFYMFATFTKENGLRGTYILVSDSPKGPFKPVSGEAVTPYEWECLDGTFFVEDGKPFCVFCHEHTQILNGTVCFTELKSDLSAPVGEAHVMFDAGSFLKRQATETQHNVTDGPFLYRKGDGKLLMIWSTIADGYKQCVAASDNGKLGGKWSHLPPIFEDNGGHGMIFKDLSGKLKLTLHCPNKSLLERPHFFNIKETEDSLEIIGE